MEAPLEGVKGLSRGCNMSTDSPNLHIQHTHTHAQSQAAIELSLSLSLSTDLHTPICPASSLLRALLTKARDSYAI